MPARRAFRSRSSWLILLCVFTAGLTFDIGMKYWTFANVIGEYRPVPSADGSGGVNMVWVPRPVKLDRQQLLARPEYNPIPPHQGLHVLPWSLLDLQLVINRGAVFGMGQDQRFFFIAFTLAALTAGLFVFGRFTLARDRMAHLAIGLILAGGVGNLYDRIVYGVVRDFLHMLPGYTLPFGWRWPGGSPELFPWVFNIADVMLLSGMALLMLHMSRVERRRKLAEQQRQDAIVAAAHDRSPAPASIAIADSNDSKSASISGTGSASS